MSLQAPWRLDYIRSLGPAGKTDGCFLCDAAVAEPHRHAELLVLWQTDLCLVLLNKFPYANGHILIAPKAHKAEWEDLTPAEITDIGLQTQTALRLLRRCVSAQGFNIGLNLGRCAGAGVPGHLHQHIVPRWGGDINYMTTIGEIRVIPQALSQLHAELIRHLAANPAGGA
jgi:ATP adenylyltransferase